MAEAQIRLERLRGHPKRVIAETSRILEETLERVGSEKPAGRNPLEG